MLHSVHYNIAVVLLIVETNTLLYILQMIHSHVERKNNDYFDKEDFLNIIRFVRLTDYRCY